MIAAQDTALAVYTMRTVLQLAVHSISALQRPVDDSPETSAYNAAVQHGTILLQAIQPRGTLQ